MNDFSVRNEGKELEQKSLTVDHNSIYIIYYK
jgi:hypothetical protein